MAFTTSVTAAAPAGFATPFLGVAMAAGALPPSLAALDAQAGGAIGRLLASGDFTGKKDETALLHPAGAAQRIFLVGLGKPAEVNRGALRRAAAQAAK
ncbi:MAG TPA: M17 family peptidase N-terminal domain-containing protein, partial [Gemmatimonadales bacterium]|nr:M17 family peptidase N-terminal domain-containing protein [Gemmatimonadales bacterium]